MYLILLIRLMHNSFSSSISPFREFFNALIFKGKSVRFQQRMKGLFANWPFFKVLLKVQSSKLFICMLGSRAFDLGVGRSGGWGGGGLGGKFEIWGDEVDDKN